MPKKKENLIIELITHPKLLELFLDFGIYLFSLAGVLLSRYLPAFHAGEDFILTLPSSGRLVMSMLVAWLVVFGFDAGGDIHSKRDRFVRRAAFALSQGFMWTTIIGV